jgi:hypothetical protein
MDFTLYEATTKAFNEDEGLGQGMMKLYDNFLMIFYIKPKQHFNLCGES